MTKAKRASSTNGIGYCMPPPEHRFSTTNQPKRMPRILPPARKSTTTELAKELIPIKQPNGSIIMLPADEAMVEGEINRAFGEDMSAAARLYAKLDREDDAWVASPRYKTPRMRKSRGKVHPLSLGLKLLDMHELLKRGIIVPVDDTEFSIAHWVRRACDIRSQRLQLAERIQRR